MHDPEDEVAYEAVSFKGGVADGESGSLPVDKMEHVFPNERLKSRADMEEWHKQYLASGGDPDASPGDLFNLCMEDITNSGSFILWQHFSLYKRRPGSNVFNLDRVMSLTEFIEWFEKKAAPKSKKKRK